MWGIFLNLFIYMLGTGALLTSYLAFSPMTRDLVVFLSRDQQITIFRYRHWLWAAGITFLAILLIRGIFGLVPTDASGGLIADGATLIGTAGVGWLIVTVLTALLLSLLFWATYVPVVMAPPRVHKLVGITEADQLLDGDSVVLGLVMGNTVRAYPRDLIARPHWFNDHIDGKRLMISYCILCNSGQAFVAEVNGRPLDLRNMTAYDNNTIYHDSDSGNFIQQLEGKVIRGPDEGATLESFPVVMATWAQWKELHPDTEVFYSPGTRLRDRVVDKMLQTMIPISKLSKRDKPWHLMHEDIDDRLPAMSFVFGIVIAGDACAYPVESLAQYSVVNDSVGGTPVVVFYDRQRGIGQIFNRELDGRVLSFEVTEEPHAVARDTGTNSQWDVSGKAIEGELASRKLVTLPHYNQLFWFSWAAFNRDTRINRGGPSVPSTKQTESALAG
jgi:hypothetical protein